MIIFNKLANREAHPEDFSNKLPNVFEDYELDDSGYHEPEQNSFPCEDCGGR